MMIPRMPREDIERWARDIGIDPSRFSSYSQLRRVVTEYIRRNYVDVEYTDEDFVEDMKIDDE